MSLQFLSDKETLPSQSHTSPVVSVCWTRPTSASQGVILSGDCKGNVKAYDAHSALAYQDLSRRHSNAVHCITTNAAGTLALSSAIDGTIALWNLTSFSKIVPAENVNENEAAEVEAGSEESRLLPLPVEDPNQLVAGSIDSLTANSTDEVKLSESWKTCLHPTAPFFASVGAAATVSLHSIPTDFDHDFGKTITVATPPPSLGAGQKDLFGLSLAFHPSGNLLAVGTNTGLVLLYAVSVSSFPSSSSSSAAAAAAAAAVAVELKLATSYADHPSPIRAIAFTSSLLLAGSDDRTITVHDVKPILSPSQPSSAASFLQMGETKIGGTVASLSGHKGWILDLNATATAAAAGGEDKIFASLGADKSIKFWDLASATKSTPVWNGGEVAMIRAFAFQPPLPADDIRAAATSINGAGDAGNGGNGVGAASMTRFVTASEDGRLRWYRGAGLG